MITNKIILFFFFALAISIECCTDAQQTLLDGCVKDFKSATMSSSRLQSSQQKTDNLWNSCKNFYKCSEGVQCKERHSLNVGLSMHCFVHTIGTSSYSHCLNKSMHSTCFKTIVERSMKILDGIEKDKKKNCDFMRNEAKACFEDGIKETDGCGEKELEEFRNVYDDFAKTLDC